MADVKDVEVAVREHHDLAGGLPSFDGISNRLDFETARGRHGSEDPSTRREEEHQPKNHDGEELQDGCAT